MTHRDIEITTPPELAELQAENNRIAGAMANLQEERIELQAEIERLREEIEKVKATSKQLAELDDSTIKQLGERLKGGQGEPVAIVTSVISRKNKLFEIDILNNSSLTIGGKLYASQPAPVSTLVLPERFDESQYRGTSLLAVRRWNACLDKVKELNQ